MNSVKNIIFSFSFLAALAGVAPAAKASEQYTPVAFYQFTSNMPESKSAAIVQAMSRHLGSTMMNVYATEIIGGTSKFSPKLELTTIGSSTYAASQLDIAIEQKVMSEISPILATLSEGEKFKFSIQILYANREEVAHLPVDSRLSQSTLEGLRAVAGLQGASFLPQYWIDTDEGDASGELRASFLTTKRLEEVRTNHPNSWFPFSSMFDFLVDKSGIRFKFASLVLPDGFSKGIHKVQPGATVDFLYYFPTANDAFIDLVKIDVARSYAANPANGKNAMHVVFGNWTGRGFEACKGDACLRQLDQIPTLHARATFTETTWWASLVGWFRSWIVSSVDLRIMLQDIWLSCDRETQKFSVMPSKSIIPIAVMTDQVLGDGRFYMLENSVTAFGINFYQLFVGSQVTTGLSDDLNASITDADHKLSELIENALNGILRPQGL